MNTMSNAAITLLCVAWTCVAYQWFMLGRRQRKSIKQQDALRQKEHEWILKRIEQSDVIIEAKKTQRPMQ